MVMEREKSLRNNKQGEKEGRVIYRINKGVSDHARGKKGGKKHRNSSGRRRRTHPEVHSQ